MLASMPMHRRQTCINAHASCKAARRRTDACGVCDGTARGVDVSGACCTSGVTDAQGVCCEVCSFCWVLLLSVLPGKLCSDLLSSRVLHHRHRCSKRVLKVVLTYLWHIPAVLQSIWLHTARCMGCGNIQGFAIEVTMESAAL